mmetsp:Transcript_6046/g.9689  ORF Transcript_6046/g.9689 Transcript_6046/m.9689 type:complete len:379 (-) Transcript_6046:61-1197(-)
MLQPAWHFFAMDAAEPKLAATWQHSQIHGHAKPQNESHILPCSEVCFGAKSSTATPSNEAAYEAKTLAACKESLSPAQHGTCPRHQHSLERSDLARFCASNHQHSQSRVCNSWRSGRNTDWFRGIVLALLTATLKSANSIVVWYQPSASRLPHAARKSIAVRKGWRQLINCGPVALPMRSLDLIGALPRASIAPRLLRVARAAQAQVDLEPGRRLRARVPADPEEQSDTEQEWQYGQVLELQEDGQVIVQWDDADDDGEYLEETLDLSSLDQVEILPEDQVLDVLDRLEDARIQDLNEVFEEVERSGGDGPEALLFSLEDVKEELETFRWISGEVAARSDELLRLEEENRQLREEQARIRRRYEESVEQAERTEPETS